MSAVSCRFLQVTYGDIDKKVCVCVCLSVCLSVNIAIGQVEACLCCSCSFVILCTDLRFELSRVLCGWLVQQNFPCAVGDTGF